MHVYYYSKNAKWFVLSSYMVKNPPHRLKINCRKRLSQSKSYVGTASTYDHFMLSWIVFI